MINDVADTNVGKMTEEEAIEIIDISPAYIGLEKISKGCSYDEWSQAVNMAIEALQKRIAKPPSRISEEFPNLGEGYWCDECGALFPYWDNERQRTNYCGNCGQRLLEEEE